MKKPLSLTLFSFFLFSTAFAQWTEIPVPAGPSVNDLTLHKDKIYTAFYTGGKVKCLRTEDYIHWSMMANLQGSTAFGNATIISEGNRLYLFAENEMQNHAIAWSSEDEGQSWSAINLPTPLPLFFTPIGDRLVCASEFAVKSSTDGGATWSTVLTVNQRIRELKKIDAQTLLLATFSSMYRSTDQSLSWEPLPAPYTVGNVNTSLLSIFVTEMAVFVEMNNSPNSTLFRTLDKGITWDLVQVPSVYNVSKVSDLHSVGDTLWGAFHYLIATSVDTGLTWNTHLTPGNNPLQLATKGDTVFVGSANGFFKSYDQANSWISGNNGWNQIGIFPEGGLYAENIYANQDRLYFFGHTGDLYSTKNDGIEWTLHSQRDGFDYHAFTGDTLLFLNPGAFRSFDNGTTWDYLPATSFGPLSGQYKYVCNSNALFAGSMWDTHLRRSFDFGHTWQPISLSISFFDDMVVANDVLYVTDSDGIVASSNDGQNFQGFNAGLENPTDIAGLWEGDGVVFVKSGGQLWRREGNQWSPASAGLFNEMGALPYINGINGEEGRILLVGSANFQPLFYLSHDNGASWEGNWAAGLPALDEDVRVQGLLHNGGIYALGRTQGEVKNQIWKYGLPVSTQETVSNQRLHLFPNPANEVVSIDFSGQTAFRGNVALHDFSGRRVWQREVEGETQVQIPLKSLSAGIYSVSVRWENGRLMQTKLVVVH